MKVALCLSGLVRNYSDCYNTHKKFFIEALNADVFIHTWSKIGSNKLPHWYTQEYSLAKHKDSIAKQEDINKKDLLSKYNPKLIEIEYPNIEYFYNKFYQKDNEKFFNNVMMHYGINRANNLRIKYEKQNNITYDIVIRCRFDLFFEHFSIFEEKIKDCISNNTIYLPPNENIDSPFTQEMKQILKKEGHKFMPNDQFAYSSSLAMNYYSSIFEVFQKNYNLYVKHAEGTLSDHLWNKNESIYKSIKVDENIKMRIHSRRWR